MNLRAPSRTLSFAVLLFTLSACATDQERTRTEGAAAGAVGGAAIGALIGGKGSTGIGALAGGAIGLLAGDAVARQKAAYAKREAALRNSANRAEQFAQQQRQQNTATLVQIAALRNDIHRLQVEQLSLTTRNNLAAADQARLTGLTRYVNGQLVQVRAEISQQQILLADEQHKAAQSHDNSLQPSLQLVAAGVRDLQSSERALEMAQAQLQLLDSKRQY